MKKIVLTLTLLFISFLSFADEMVWFNLKTGEVEYYEGLPPVERIPEFLPQNPAAQGLYRVYIAMGKSPEESMFLVLEAVVGGDEKRNKIDI